jgi:hypothetical protein
MIHVPSAVNLPFDPEQGLLVRDAPGQGPGYWAGAPGAFYDTRLREFYLVYRLRFPRGVLPDRGAEICIARSRDGVQFNDVWSGTKDELGSPSIERCALTRAPDGRWRLYVSYVDGSDGRWRIDLVEAPRPDAFRLSNTRPVLTADQIGAEGVKDPFLFQVAGLHHMVVSFATRAEPADDPQLHGTADAYNTGLITSATGLATSDDGVDWQWEGEIFAPAPTGWDAYCSRIGCLWYDPPAWLALYDGSASVEQNYEERTGLAFTFDLRHFHRVTRRAPLMTSPHARGTLRYFDLLRLPDATFLYYEMSRPDASHDLRVFRVVH